MKLYVKASKKSNLELLKSFLGKDEWVLVNNINFYSGKVIQRALIKINRIRGSVWCNIIPLDFNYKNAYDNVLSYIVDHEVSIDNALRHEVSALKDCVQVVEPVESYTTAQLREAIDNG